jgi:hypothetical protein
MVLRARARVFRLKTNLTFGPDFNELVRKTNWSPTVWFISLLDRRVMSALDAIRGVDLPSCGSMANVWLGVNWYFCGGWEAVGRRGGGGCDGVEHAHACRG